MGKILGARNLKDVKNYIEKINVGYTGGLKGDFSRFFVYYISKNSNSSKR